jgi:hypothetical protein
MLSYEDCVGLCDLTEEEVDAIAEHDHIPQIVAAELGYYLVHTEKGVPMIKRFIIEDIEHAKQHGNEKHELRLKLVLKHFVENHSELSKSIT